MTELATRYIDLVKRCLTREIFIHEEMVDVMGWPTGGPLGDPEEVWPVLKGAGLRIVKPLDDTEGRLTGKEWPMFAETMAGTARLDNVDELVTRALAEGVPGDLVETGVWRGGIVVLMRALLEAHGDADRCVWACDSFEGLPIPDPDQYPADATHVVEDDFRDQTAVSLDEVKANIDRYRLLDDRVKFLPGWFRDTLPDAPIDQIAVLRLDGDLYESTMDALVHLEPRVAAGGFVIIDDYNSWEPCRQAVTDYRQANNITAEIHEIDWTGAWWRKDGAAPS
ncbi:MAG: TylF/MycF/NovP-related O-methyltransferase [Acidimicrobiales bacterium]